jgi:protein SCO1/2
MQTRHTVRGIARASVLICILTFAFCITEISAQQQPGLPGSMGFTGGIVASNVPPKISHVTFSQRLGEKLPLDAKFKDESGRDVVLGDYFGKKPVVLAFVYFQCPMLARS